MMWNQKESSLLGELKVQEQLCAQKYGEYAAKASDPELKSLFGNLQQTEQQHLQIIDGMAQGRMPSAAQLGEKPKPGTAGQPVSQLNVPACAEAPASPEHERDAYLCRDALDTEKHVSSVYDTSVFEFRAPMARQVLNTIQSQEQQHGEQLYAYMAQHGMYQQ